MDVNRFRCPHCRRVLSLPELDRARVSGPGPVSPGDGAQRGDSRSRLFWTLGLSLSGLVLVGVVCLIIVLANSGDQGGSQGPFGIGQPAGKASTKFNVFKHVGAAPPVVTGADGVPTMRVPCSSCGSAVVVRLDGERWKGACANPACPRPVEFDVPKGAVFTGKPPGFK